MPTEEQAGLEFDTEGGMDAHLPVDLRGILQHRRSLCQQTTKSKSGSTTVNTTASTAHATAMCARFSSADPIEERFATKRAYNRQRHFCGKLANLAFGAHRRCINCC